MSKKEEADPGGNKVAPAPPPPAHFRAAMDAGLTKGFQPKAKWMVLEVILIFVFALALGTFAVYFGGRLAAWMTPLVPMSVDHGLGEASQKQMSLSTEECTNPAAQKYVEDIAARLLQNAGALPFEFSFRVVDTPEVNAFALPGGFVTVNRGLLEAAESGEEVAGVLGHEIQHALLRHGTKRILRQLGGSTLLAVLFGGTDLHGYSQLAAQFNALSYDRSQESEADKRGVELLVASEIDPSGLATFFERLKHGVTLPPEMLSTHPDPGSRAQLIAAAAFGRTFKKLPSPAAVPCHLADR